MVPDEALLKNIEYRLQAVHLGSTALRQMRGWEAAPSMQVFFDGKLRYEGLATGFTNGAIEAGVIHARALLEFLGVTCKRGISTKLAPRTREHPGSAYIEHFPPLEKMTVAQVIHAYPGDPDEAEGAIAWLMQAANKSLAHLTSEWQADPEEQHLLEIGIRGVPILVINNFYLPLKLPPPNYEAPWRYAS